MSIKPIIQSLFKLIDLHKELLSISEQKTELVKAGTIDKLQQLIVKERKQIRLLEQMEGKRQQEVEKWFSIQGLPTSDATITTILETLENESEKVEITKASEQLTDYMMKLKQQESLNQTLIDQSLQFVQLSLDLLNPSISNLNYGKQKQEMKSYNRSIFDSQA
ncbi:flagellar protein FlgN [Oceanobacillus sp. Castelsardo]|uniref:flagellar protein FlgN n=1 Tax=Oceanobacillus sp. Castelsardo TaxID=1851204 RepID=UPI000837E1A6|nr:flagellar protein FlgN [Oceanobacillus sp. Castelsardo]